MTHTRPTGRAKWNTDRQRDRPSRLFNFLCFPGTVPRTRMQIHTQAGWDAETFSLSQATQRVSRACGCAYADG